MNAYGLTADDVQHISDSLITTQNLGVTTVAELASNMGRAIATASGYGVSLENLEAAYIATTKSGISTAESTTYLSSMMAELGKNGSGVSKIIKEKTGQSFAELMANGSSLGDVLGILHESVDGNSEAFMNLWSSQEAGKAANALVNQGLDTFNENLKTLETQAGTTETAYGQMTDTFAWKMQDLQTKGQNLGIKLFEALYPVLDELIGKAMEFVDNMDVDSVAEQLTGLVSGVVPLITKLAEAISFVGQHLDVIIPIVGALMGFSIASKVIGVVSGIMQLFSGISALAPVIAALTGPIGAVIAIVVGVIAGIVTLWNTNEGFRNAVIGIWEAIKSAFKTAIEAIKGFFEGMATAAAAVWEDIKSAFATVGEAFGEVIDAIKGFFEGLFEKAAEIGESIVDAFNTVKEGISNVWSAITEAVSTAWETIKNLIQVAIMLIKEIITAAVQLWLAPWMFIWENFGTQLTAAWETFKSLISGAMEAIKTGLQNAWNAIVAFITPILETIKTIISTAWEAIKSATTTVFNAVKSVLTTVWNAIKSVIQTIVNTISTAISATWNVIKSVTTTIFNAVKSVLTSIWNAIKSVITSVINAIKSVITSVWNAIKSTITSVMNSIKSVVSSVWNAIKSVISSVINGIKSTISNGMNAAKNTVSNVLNAIKSKFSSIMNGAASVVSGAINRIKGFFNFSWSLPKLKLPHPTISGKFSLNPPSVPHFGISWYDKGGIFNSPTVIGVGEKRPEFVGALDDLRGIVRDESGGGGGDLIPYMQRMLTTLDRYFPEFAKNKQLMLNGAFVGEVAPAMDSEFGKRAVHKERWN